MIYLGRISLVIQVDLCQHNLDSHLTTAGLSYSDLVLPSLALTRAIFFARAPGEVNTIPKPMSQLIQSQQLGPSLPDDCELNGGGVL